MKIGSRVYYVNLDEYEKEARVVEIKDKVNEDTYSVSPVDDKGEVRPISWKAPKTLLFQSVEDINKMLTKAQKQDLDIHKNGYYGEVEATKRYYKELKHDIKMLKGI